MVLKRLLQVALTLIGSLLPASEFIEMKAGNLRLALDPTGKLTALEDVGRGTNYLATVEPSYLLAYQTYGAPGNAPRIRPVSVRITERVATHTRLELTYPTGVVLTVVISSKEGYFRIELVNVQSDKDISHVVWGPYRTTMQGPIGEWLGLNRSNDFSIGLLSLEPNTDGRPGDAALSAFYQGYGSDLELHSYDHTRTREYRAHRHSTPIPGLTVIGSAIALFGVPRGRDPELHVIERIELDEGLPHPIYHGTWNKRSLESQKPCIWVNMDEQNADRCIELGEQLAAGTLCRFHGFFRNWGHFEIDPKIYPGGLATLKASSQRARAAGIGLTTYTLTGFLKPISGPEPYLSPVPDARLQTWTPKTELLTDAAKDGVEIAVRNGDDLREVIKHPFKVIRVGNELIEYNSFDLQGDVVLLKGCQRGAYYTTACPHAKGSVVTFMFLSGYHNFYPGTVEMNNELARNIARVTVQGGMGKVLLDGYESCYETGHGDYAQNVFLKTLYDMCGEKDMLIATSLSQGNYNWHMVSYQSWGEYDLHKGFRGTMLDYRLMRQVQLRRNLIPNKLGQYYPNKASQEDIEWLMALAAGWESGVDLHVGLDEFVQNPECEKIAKAIQLWERARLEGVFTDAQKMQLRQTDGLHTLSRKPNGAWDLKFVRRWRHGGVKMRPPSAITVEPLSGGEPSVSPCSIDWSWTHNPGIYAEAGVSDDLIHKGGKEETRWKVTYPVGPDPQWSGAQQELLFVLRVPEDAPCAVRNPKVSIEHRAVEIAATLQPGQYLSTTHLIPMACVYDRAHRVIGEAQLLQTNPYWYIPDVKKGVPSTVRVSCEPVDPKARPEVRVNLRFDHDIVPEQHR